LPLAATTFSLARLRALPHSMACFRASPSAFKTALCSVWIWPMNERALLSLGLGIAFLSGANGPRPGSDFTMRNSDRLRSGFFTGRSDYPRRDPGFHVTQPVAHRLAHAHELRANSADAEAL